MSYKRSSTHTTTLFSGHDRRVRAMSKEGSPAVADNQRHHVLHTQVPQYCRGSGVRNILIKHSQSQQTKVLAHHLSAQRLQGQAFELHKLQKPCD